MLKWLKIFKRIIRKAQTQKFFEVVDNIHKNTQIEGILISVLKFLPKIDISLLKTDKKIHKLAEIISAGFRIVQVMMKGIKEYPYPLEKAKILIKVVYFNFGKRLAFLNKAFKLYHNDFSEFGDNEVKQIVNQNLKFLNKVVTFTYQHDNLRTRLNN